MLVRTSRAASLLGAVAAAELRSFGAATRLMNSSPTASGNGMVPVAPAIG